ncbi:hypothetical protein [Streptomyces sp. NPDC003393]
MRREATERFVRAAPGADFTALTGILAPDVAVWTDGGGPRRQAGLRPVRGRDRAVRLFTSYAARRGPARAGDPPPARQRRRRGGAVPGRRLLRGDGHLTPEGDQVSGVHTVTHPGKLRQVRPDGMEDAADAATPPAC